MKCTVHLSNGWMDSSGFEHIWDHLSTQLNKKNITEVYLSEIVVKNSYILYFEIILFWPLNKKSLSSFFILT